MGCSEVIVTEWVDVLSNNMEKSRKLVIGSEDDFFSIRVWLLGRTCKKKKITEKSMQCVSLYICFRWKNTLRAATCLRDPTFKG